ncbi:hypothetical protein TNCT1_69940 [Streptomyces sp. 1-11]|nr:hypothetical protein TNCT1_69940 [Streptomyces sp. 1-11]
MRSNWKNPRAQPSVQLHPPAPTGADAHSRTPHSDTRAETCHGRVNMYALHSEDDALRRDALTDVMHERGDLLAVRVDLVPLVGESFLPRAGRG